MAPRPATQYQPVSLFRCRRIQNPKPQRLTAAGLFIERLTRCLRPNRLARHSTEQVVGEMFKITVPGDSKMEESLLSAMSAKGKVAIGGAVFVLKMVSGGLGRDSVFSGQYIGELQPAQPETWNGEGLPPVGTVCEWLKDKKWKRAEIVYLSQHTVLAKLLDEMGAKDPEFALDPEDAEFRPIRTAEQIAKAERSKACDEIYGVLRKAKRPDNRSDMAEALYDAGYRKVDQ